MEKLKRQLAEAEAALETRKKPTATDTRPRVLGEALMIDEWVNKPETSHSVPAEFTVLLVTGLSHSA